MFKIIIFIIFLFILLNQFNDINKKHEEFKNVFRENFQNNTPDINSLVKKESYAVKSNDNVENNMNNNENDNNTNENDNNSNDNENDNKSDNNGDEKCSKDNGCLFGCPKNKSNIMDEKDNRETNIDEMIMTIEDTEKICNLIEDKDKERKEREEREHMKKQIELNKRFLIQQKAQNKQIVDLEKIVKDMTFTQNMNEVGVEKCGLGADQCLSDKERELVELVKNKRNNQKSVKVNFNLENFEKSFLDELKKKFNFSNSELSKLYEGLKNGKIDPNQLKSQFAKANNNNNNPYRKSYEKGNNGCPNCKIDLSEYIDRCKIPCNKCRDPAWNCPQDIK